MRHPSALWKDGWITKNNRRVVTGSWPVTGLTDAYPEIVSELAAPVMRTFTTDFVLTPDWIRGQAAKWLTCGSMHAGRAPTLSENARSRALTAVAAPQKIGR